MREVLENDQHFCVSIVSLSITSEFKRTLFDSVGNDSPRKSCWGETETFYDNIWKLFVQCLLYNTNGKKVFFNRIDYLRSLDVTTDGFLSSDWRLTKLELFRVGFIDFYWTFREWYASLFI